MWKVGIFERPCYSNLESVQVPSPSAFLSSSSQVIREHVIRDTIVIPLTTNGYSYFDTVLSGGVPLLPPQTEPIPSSQGGCSSDSLPRFRLVVPPVLCPAPIKTLLSCETTPSESLSGTKSPKPPRIGLQLRINIREGTPKTLSCSERKRFILISTVFNVRPFNFHG